MAKIVEERLGRRAKSRRPMASRAITSAQGKKVRAPLVDAESDTFGEDLLQSFARSVSRARRENKLKTGTADDDNKGN